MRCTVTLTELSAFQAMILDFADMLSVAAVAGDLSGQMKNISPVFNEVRFGNLHRMNTYRVQRPSAG